MVVCGANFPALGMGELPFNGIRVELVLVEHRGEELAERVPHDPSLVAHLIDQTIDHILAHDRMLPCRWIWKEPLLMAGQSVQFGKSFSSLP